jgi:[ribosomal protein S5]-alanine N-acetyltransferase
MLPDTFHRARLKLRLIEPKDAGPIFDSYAQDATVTRFVIWRPHQSRSVQLIEIDRLGDEFERAKLAGTAAALVVAMGEVVEGVK